MTPLFRLLQHIPAVRALQDERDVLRGEQNSMRLKLRAASAEMDVIEEQCRVLRRERDGLAAAMARQAAEHASQLQASLAASAALTKERDDLGAECRALTAQKDAAEAERSQAARDLEELRGTAGFAGAAR